MNLSTLIREMLVKKAHDTQCEMWNKNENENV